MHWIQAPLLYLQSPNHHQTSISDHLITIQPTHNHRFSSLVTLAHPPTSSSVLITDCSFQYASPCFLNQLLPSLYQPHSNSDSSLSLPTSVIFTASVPRPLSLSITTSRFHSQFKNYIFYKSFPSQKPMVSWLQYIWDFLFLVSWHFFSYGTVR